MRLLKVLAVLAVMMFATFAAKAQDVITKNDGTTVVAKVLEITPSEVKYKIFTNIDGPTYILLKTDVRSIVYKNGQKEEFLETKPQSDEVQSESFLSGNQNMTDSELLKYYNLQAFDSSYDKEMKKFKKYRTIAWIGAGIFFVGGTVAGTMVIDNEHLPMILCYGGAVVCSSVWFTSWYLKAKIHKKRALELATVPVLEQSILKFGHSELSMSLNMIQANTQSFNMPGFGLGVNLSF